jgi:hypothetical protein
MNARDDKSKPDMDEANLNAEHPWLGLASFTESSSSYFHGREEEVAELVRRVQRKTLTILFGQSGLGKTSILNAGVVPRLRGQGFCPVYVRIDYAEGTPSPSEQIKQAVLKESRAQGQWTQAGIASEGETLWEFLHHRDDTLHDADGRPLLPLLIFDQFEELFTLAQSDEAGRQKAALFIQDLADLVENRAPQSLEARMAEDDAAAEAFDFSRNDYRVLISLREDYLAPLEGLKGQMPSITQNRMRLAPMTGTQAMAAVRGPGGHLVTEEVAAAIVRFVAGGAELINAEVEPSLLSLICRELNDARLAKGQREITVDLLAGSHAAILSDFYERALADQPAALRTFIEDVLLTDSGYRENVAEERVKREFATAGATPDALPLLVNRRLLRIEERLDLRRVELTHDVLCSVVKASRDARREREAREQAEAQTAALAQRAREARRQLKRARQVATVCIFLTIGAIGASAYAYWSSQRAKAAEAMANASRTQAESLLTFLMDDFFQELEPLGRLDIVQQLSQRALDYYKNLPPELRNGETDRNEALALVRQAATLQSQNHMKDSQPLLAEALKRLDARHAAGDTSEATTMGLALALRWQARQLMQTGGFAEAAAPIKRAEGLLAQAAQAPDASRPLRLLYGQLLQYHGYIDARNEDLEPSITHSRQAMAVADGLIKDHPEDLRAAYLYVSAVPWAMEALQGLHRQEELETLGREGLRRADAMLEQRPGHRSALGTRGLIYSDLAQIAGEKLDLVEARRLTLASATDYKEITRNDPTNATAWNNLSVAYFGVFLTEAEAGNVKASIGALNEAVESIGRTPETTFMLVNAWSWQSMRAQQVADTGDLASADRDVQGALEKTVRINKTSKGSDLKVWLACSNGAMRGNVELARGNVGKARTVTQEAMALARGAETFSSPNSRSRYLDCEFTSTFVLTEAFAREGDFASVEKSVDLLFGLLKPDDTTGFGRKRDLAGLQIWKAYAQARQGHADAARETLAPALKFHTPLAGPASQSAVERLNLARALFVQGLTEPRERNALLARSARMMDGLPVELRNTLSTRLWRGWVADAQNGKA